jgi:hypothetical protein
MVEYKNYEVHRPRGKGRAALWTSLDADTEGSLNWMDDDARNVIEFLRHLQPEVVRRVYSTLSAQYGGRK